MGVIKSDYKAAVICNGNTVNAADRQLAFRNARCFGTEGRASLRVQPSQELRDFVIFNEAEVEEVQPCEFTQIKSLDIERYSRLGCGGFATVFLGSYFGATVAIKRMPELEATQVGEEVAVLARYP